MYIPKRYGESKVDTCPFCGKQAFSLSVEGVPVCAAHKERRLPLIRCACGKALEQKKGKFGIFFVCINCGPVSMKRMLEMNDLSRERKVTEVRSDDPEYFS